MNIFSHIGHLYQNDQIAVPVKARAPEKRKLEAFIENAKRVGGVQPDLEAQVQKIQIIVDKINNLFNHIRIYTLDLTKEYNIASARAADTSDQLNAPFSNIIFEMMGFANIFRINTKSFVDNNTANMEHLILLENSDGGSSAQSQPKPQPQPARAATAPLTTQLKRVDQRKYEFKNLNKQMRKYIKEVTKESDLASARLKQTGNERHIRFCQIIFDVLKNTINFAKQTELYAENETTYFDKGVTRLIALHHSSQQSSTSTNNISTVEAAPAGGVGATPLPQITLSQQSQSTEYEIVDL